MLRRLASILTIISLVFLPFFFASKAFAAPVTDPSTIDTLPELDEMVSGDGSLDKNLQDFCKKRQGNQMNLETWYSGKCTADTFSGEGVGFSDIVILDLAEKISGQKDPSQTFSSTLKKVFQEIKNSNPTGISSEEQESLALEYARQELLYNQSGLIDQAGKMIGFLFQNQPVSARSYLAYVSQNLQKHKIISPALAAPNGTGFNTFSPFLKIWIAVRNLAYFALVVFFIVYGFMMMFRVNLGQKTVITVQLAIPKLIVTLLIITFSYAIVGLVYDLMWVVIYFIFGYLDSQKITQMGMLGDVAKFASGNSSSGMSGSFILNSIVAGPAAIFGILNLIVGGTAAGITTVVSLSGIGLIVMLIIFIAVLVSYGKLFIKLISAFISVVISIVTGPIILLGNAFPGSSAIGTWFRGIVANLSVFPVTILFLLFSYILMIQPLIGICNPILGKIQDFFGGVGTFTCEKLFGVYSLVDPNNAGITGVPLIAPPGNAAVDTSGLLALLGVGLLLMASKYVDIVKDALKVPPFKYGTDITDALKMGIKYAPSTPFVGDRVSDSKAYQTIGQVSGVKPQRLEITKSGGFQQDPSKLDVNNEKGKVASGGGE